MIKQLSSIILSFVLCTAAIASVEINSADQAALESISGIGTTRAKAIVEERQKNGPFKDANDLSKRVKGVGKKSIAKLQENGLTINGIDGKGTSTPIPKSKAKKHAKAMDNHTSKIPEIVPELEKKQ